jgi:AcrR family transcriptional regulator
MRLGPPAPGAGSTGSRAKCEIQPQMTDTQEPTPEGRRARRNRETRRALLDAAMALLKERGIYGTRVEDITERADVGKGVFYNHFESKEALVAQLVRDGVEILERDHFPRVAAEPTLAGRIAGLMQAQESFFAAHPDFALVLHQARGLLLLDAERSVSLRAAFSDYLHLLSRHIPGPGELGAWRAEDLLDVAAVIVGASAGYRSFCIAVGRPIRVATIGAALIDGVPHLLEARRRTPRPRAPQRKHARTRR